MIHKLDRITAKDVKSHIQAIFIEYRSPDILVSDNSPCFGACECEKVMEKMGAHHNTSS